MGVNRAVAAIACKVARPATHHAAAVGGECAVLHGAERLSVADAAEGLSALHDGAAVFLSVAKSGLFAPIHPGVGMQGREQDGREGSPAAGIIDSQSVKTTEAG